MSFLFILKDLNEKERPRGTNTTEFMSGHATLIKREYVYPSFNVHIVIRFNNNVGSIDIKWRHIINFHYRRMQLSLYLSFSHQNMRNGVFLESCLYDQYMTQAPL